jgi:ABC-type multidrug transport system fused ATPase/permease subunit
MQKYLHTTWRLWKLLKPFHNYFYLQLFFTIIIQSLILSNTYFISKIIDAAVGGNVIFIYQLLLAYLASILVIRLVSFLADRQEMKKSYGAIQQFLEEYSLRNIFKFNPSQYTENHSAIKQRVVDQGESAIQDITETLVLSLMPLIVTFIFSIFAISRYSLSIGIISALTILVVIFGTFIFTNKWRPLQRKNIENWNNQSKIRVEAFEHLYTIKIMGVNIFYLKKYLKNRLSIVGFHVDVWLMNTNFRNLRDLFISVSEYICLALAIYFFAKGLFTIGIVYALFSWVSKAYGQLGTVNQILRKTPTNYIYLEQYLNLVDMEPDFMEESDVKFMDGDITFKNLSFKYPKGDSNVLQDININIKRGQKVAFVGASGSGKTTITRLLLRAYDYNNFVSKNENKLDSKESVSEGDLAASVASSIKINGVELKEINANDLRTHIGYVEQHVDLFDDTIKNNILLGVDEKTLKEWERDNKLEEKLEEIAKLSRIDEFYHRLGEQKFETHIGERGIKLSGGERQRIGIARAIIKNPSILIFDEATSALDTVNEKYIKEAIDNVSRGRTTIIIAHRLSTVVDSDIIFVMNLGKVVAQGTHTELLESSEYYGELIKHQDLK